MSNRYLTAVLMTLSLLIGQSVDAAITWTFNVTDVGVGFNDPTEGAARTLAMQQSADIVSSFFPTHTASIVMTVNGAVTDDSTLAAAGSQYVSSDAGFGNRGVVGQKILGASTDPNGTLDDGSITWNFQDFTWDLDDVIDTPGAFDFKSTMIHELLHAVGFISAVNEDGTSFLGGPGPDMSGNPFVPFDEFIAEHNAGTTSRIISGSTLSSMRWNRASVGGTGTVPATNDTGLYFDGPNARMMNGGNPVPLYSTTTWEDGSSGSHTDDLFYTGMNPPKLIMNAATVAGQGIRSLSPMEIGIFRDLGFNAIPEPSAFAFMGLAICGGVVRLAVRARRKKNAK